MGTITITDPVSEPVSLELGRLQARVTAEGSPPTHPEDALIEIYIGAAREWAEDYTGLALATATLELQLDAFPEAEIEITRGPVQSILSVTYIDDDEVEQTIDPTNYTLDESSDRIWLLPASGFTWPTAGDFSNAVRIRYFGGYNLAGESPTTKRLPKRATLAMLLVVGHLWENRSESIEKALLTIPMGAKVFLEGMKIRQGMA